MPTIFTKQNFKEFQAVSYQISFFKSFSSALEVQNYNPGLFKDFKE